MVDPKPPRRTDLHLHSTASDGLLSPTELAAACCAAGIRTAALTDHDTTVGYPEFSAAATPLGVLPIVGAEIAAQHQGEEVHLLAFFPKLPRGVFAALLARLTGERRARAEEMLSRLAALGMPLPDAGEVLSHPQVGRPHVARALVRQGFVRDTGEAFRRYLVPGAPAYVERWRPEAADAIARCHDEGGIVSLAHPANYRSPHLGELAAEGLDAVEVNHPSATRSRRQLLRRETLSLGLLRTGGSDFHGGTESGPGAVGLGPTDARHFLERLLA